MKRRAKRIMVCDIFAAQAKSKKESNRKVSSLEFVGSLLDVFPYLELVSIFPKGYFSGEDIEKCLLVLVLLDLMIHESYSSIEHSLEVENLEKVLFSSRLHLSILANRWVNQLVMVVIYICIY